MRWSAAVLACLGLAAGACSKKSTETRAEQARTCAAMSLDTLGTARCLVQLHGWDPAEARLAAGRQERASDSLKTWHEDSLWRAEADLHRRQLSQCRSGDVTGCLLSQGWPEARAKAAAESLWARDASAHRRQVRDCANRRGVNPASCLMLYYQWTSPRALATADSIMRARMAAPASPARRR
jgi:hypothetical protein